MIGGGIAGLAAAIGLAERGVRVTLLERREQLGGRLAGWADTLSDGSPVTMSRGFHAFFRQYYNLRGLLRRANPSLGMLRGLPDYPLLGRDGTRDSFRRVPRTPPLSALGFAALSPSFGVRELAGLDAAAALPLLDVRVPEVYARLDGVSAADFLDRVRFPERARHLAFEVFSRSFFVDPAELSAAELALMFHVYFLGSSEGLLFDVPDEPYPQALWDPLAAYLTRLGVELRTGTEVERVQPAGGGRHRVSAGRETVPVDAVVLALDTGGLRHLAAASPDLADARWRRRMAGLRTAPRSSSAACGWTAPSTPAAPASSAPAVTGRWTTSACWSAGRARRGAGRPAPAAPWWSSTRTPPPPAATARPNSCA
ncbi:FAD-dependent oxidoreductase [Streptomyces sp. AD16]|nr:FAD-dependent oxidoreductase [Streptomyces sp. AD16]